MKTILILIIALFISSCCPSVNEGIVSTTTQHVNTAQPPAIVGDMSAEDNSLIWEWYAGELQRLYYENDSLRGITPDTVKIKEYIQSMPHDASWKAVKVTRSGDSVYITFRLRNSDGTFYWRIVPAPIKVLSNDTNTTITVQYQEPWYKKIWSGFKDVILVGLILVLMIVLVLQRLKK